MAKVRVIENNRKTKRMKTEQIILHANCLEVLAKLEENSIDAMATDPPYGISFMNKGWDAQVPGVEYWSAVLRVLKPGAYGLVMCGTRTSHRLGCALEDAGFEIRDKLGWIYGQGFPKNYDFTCKCSGNTVSNNHDKSKTEYDVRSLQPTDISTPLNDEDKSGEVLQHGLQEQSTQSNGSEGFKPEVSEGKQPSVEGRTVHRTGKGVCDGTQTGSSESASERVCIGAHTDSREKDRATVETRRGNTSCESRSPGQPSGESKGIQESQSTLDQGTSGGRSLCKRCGGVKGLDGFGTCLKPAWEDIYLVRKPFKGTVAQNVLEHGTGALNIDACRIEGIKPQVTQGINSNPSSYNVTSERRISGDPNQGRWPANLILDPEAGAMLDEQSGVSKSSFRAPSNNQHNGVTNLLSTTAKAGADYSDKGGASRFFKQVEYDGPPSDNINVGGGQINHVYHDEGGVSRFFYCAKAGVKEREAGLHTDPVTVGDGRQKAIDNPYQRGKTKRRNTHTTVKPLSLCRWLSRLICPPGGTLLDPFAGSGSFGCAAAQEDFNWIGVEIEDESATIAFNRIKHWREQQK